jgi:hypothetical protein
MSDTIFSASPVDIIINSFSATYSVTALDEYSSYSALPNYQYFVKTGSQYENEKNLYDLLLTESYNKFGVRGQYYITTYDTNYDKIYGEDGNRRFTRKFDIMTYYELPKELELWSKFGIEGLDNFKMYMSKLHYRAARTNGNYSYDVPRIGDVINIVYNNRYYEIIDISEEEEIFLQRKHSWTLTVQVFKDDHMSLDNSLSADDLTNYINQTDIFDLSATIDNKKTDILYKPPITEVNEDPMAGW